MNIKLRPIILAGGTGARLWPLSTEERPKQFIPMFKGLSLFDLTLQRLNKKSLFKRPIIVTLNRYLDFVNSSLLRTGIEAETIILEPEAKNTFPAITTAVMLALKKDSSENFFVSPSDHYISSNKNFHDSCGLAGKEIKNGGLILMGVRPEQPSIEYGYISTEQNNRNIKNVVGFIEKPNLDKSKKLISQPNVYWNAGVFAFNGSWFLNELEKINKKMLLNISDIVQLESGYSNVFTPNKILFKEVQKISFDKAFVEENTKTSMTILNAGWSDLGSWFSLAALHKNLDSLFIPYFEEAYDRYIRPWGFFETLMENDSCKVKLLSILPNEKLSLQKHQHRKETWHVIQGTATIVRGKERFILQPGEIITIKKNQVHRLENLGDDSLEVIEIQTGSYFGEDDIVRIEDSYGRIDSK